MSDIALLMTGVLATGQPSPPILPEQPLVQSNNDGVEQSTGDQLFELVPTTQMTPPEFIQPNGTIPSTPPTSTIERSSGSHVSSTDTGGNTLQSVPFQEYGQKLHQKYTKNLLKLPALRENALRSSPQTSPLPILSQPTDSMLPQQRRATKIGDKSTSTDEQGSNNKMGTKKAQNFTSPSLPPLQFGDSGISVRVLQKLLLSNGYSIQVDGVFGALTETAVKAFQYRRNLIVDGIVGQKTWYELTN